MPALFPRRWKGLQKIMGGLLKTFTLTIAYKILKVLYNERTFKILALVKANPCIDTTLEAR